MRRRCLAVLLACAGVGACTAPLHSTLDQPLPSVPARVLAAAEARAWDAAVRESLSSPAGGTPRTVLDPRALFEHGSAMLRPRALTRLSVLAETIRRYPGAVVHVLAYGAEDSDLEPALRLSARRAETVATALAEDGVAPARLRAEGRSGANDRLWLLLVPVVEGSEAQAWVPPADPS